MAAIFRQLERRFLSVLESRSRGVYTLQNRVSNCWHLRSVVEKSINNQMNKEVNELMNSIIYFFYYLLLNKINKHMQITMGKEASALRQPVLSRGGHSPTVLTIL